MISYARVNLLHFPRRALDIILSFLEDQFLLGLREINKETRNIVDASLFRVREMEIHFGMKFNAKRDEIRMCLTNENQFGSIWKIGIAHVMSQITAEFELDSEDLIVTLKSNSVKEFLGHLNPNLDGVLISEIDFLGVPSEIVRDCSEFCEGHESAITFGGFKTQHTDFVIWLDFIRSTKSDYVNCKLWEFNNDSIEFLLKVAEEVEGISLSVKNNDINNFNFIRFAREIFNRKCEHLDIGKNICTLSGADIENLLKIFNSKDKCITFIGYVVTPTTDIQIGSYKMESDEGNLVQISHLDLLDDSDD